MHGLLSILSFLFYSCICCIYDFMKWTGSTAGTVYCDTVRYKMQKLWGASLARDCYRRCLKSFHRRRFGSGFSQVFQLDAKSATCSTAGQRWQTRQWNESPNLWPTAHKHTIDLWLSKNMIQCNKIFAAYDLRMAEKNRCDRPIDLASSLSRTRGVREKTFRFGDALRDFVGIVEENLFTPIDLESGPAISDQASTCARVSG